MMIHFKKQIGVICLFMLLSPLVSAQAPQTFAEAKREAKEIFAAHPLTLYCQCVFNAKHEIDLASCQMQEAEKVSKRAKRVEYDHMMPAEQFGHQFPCWREPLCDNHNKPYKGRKCCTKIDPQFRQAEAELYNLWPAVGLVNQARSNYRYGMVNSTAGFYGCKLQIDKKERKAEPSDTIKGLVARANLFMSAFYRVKLSPSQRKLLEAWDKQFPPDAWEKEWAQKIATIEGYENPYITQRGG
jgi:deoxyribonuclease-1